MSHEVEARQHRGRATNDVAGGGGGAWKDQPVRGQQQHISINPPTPPAGRPASQDSAGYVRVSTQSKPT